MLAHAWLAVTAAAAKPDVPPDSPSAYHGDPADEPLVPLSLNEIRDSTPA